jgi:hypothetical protein
VFVKLDPDLVDLLVNYDQFVCRNCGAGCSVPIGETPDACRTCGGTVFRNLDEEEH